MKSLPHRLDRTILIQADREIVFRFFTDSERWAAWWGAGSAIDPRPGGQMRIRYPNGVEAVGEVIEVLAPERIVFTYGYASGKPIPPGSSRVTIRLQAQEKGTRLSLLHEFAEAAHREGNDQGWRYQLSLFANVVANDANSGAARIVDAWFAAWSIADDQAREKALAEAVTAGIRFHDQYSSIEGIADLVPHLGAAQRFMPGLTLRRAGNIRHCQGMVLSEWVATGSDGQKRMAGTNVFVFGIEGRIESVTGFYE